MHPDLTTGNIDKARPTSMAPEVQQLPLPTGDLAGVAKRNDGLKALPRLMYPAGRRRNLP